MRISICALALAIIARGAMAQQPAANGTPPAPQVSAPPECSARSASRADSLCVTRSAAIAQALGANPQLRVANALAQQARAQKVQRVALPDPTFTAEWDNARGPFGAGGASGRVLGASLTVPFFDKFRLNGRIGTAGIRQSEFDSVTVRQSIASQASQTYDSVLHALRQLATLHGADSLARDFAAKTRARFDAGTVARLDVVNADVAVGQVGNQLIATERDIADAKSALNRLLGRPLAAPLLTADSLDIPPPVPALEVLIASAAAHRPELASVRSQQASAHASTQLAREFWYPDLFIGISRDYLADPTPGYLTTGISLPIPLFYWNHSKGEIAAARYHEDELDATLRDLQAGVDQDVRVAYSAASTSLRQAIYIRDQLLPAARQAYRIAAASYGLGGSSALEVNAARTALLDAESQYTDALTAANSARAELERAVAAPLATIGTGAPR